MKETGSEKATSPGAESLKGQRLGRYLLQEKLGAGGMGTVYKALDTLLNRAVAVKVLSSQFSQNQKYIERFLREARATAALDHPHVVRAIDVGQEGQHFFFVMEFVEGSNVLKLLKARKRFSQSEALPVAIQIAQALQHAAKKNIIHRDIKPENIMVCPSGQAVLTDLGLAKATDDRATTITQTGQTLLSPHYGSPEQIRGDPDIDGRTDIYSLGMALYHMVTGKLAFDGPSAAVIMAQHLHEPFPDPRAACPDLSASFCQVLQMMVEKDPADRYQTPDELLEDLLSVEEGRPPEHAGSPQPDLDKRRGRARRRALRGGRKSRLWGPVAVAAASILLLIGALGVAVSLSNSRAPVSQKPAPLQPPTPSRPPSGENREQSAYAVATGEGQKAANDPAARMALWKKFLQDFPKGEYSGEARRLYAQAKADDYRIRYLNLADRCEDRLSGQQFQEAEGDLASMEGLTREATESGIMLEIPMEQTLEALQRRLDRGRNEQRQEAAYRQAQAKAAGASDPKARIGIWKQFQKEFPGVENQAVESRLDAERHAILQECETRYRARIGDFDAGLARGELDKAEAVLKEVRSLAAAAAESGVALAIPEGQGPEALSRRIQREREHQALLKDYQARYTGLIIRIRTALIKDQLEQAETDLAGAEGLVAEAQGRGVALSLPADDQPEVLRRALQQKQARQVLYKEWLDRYETLAASFQGSLTQGDLGSAEADLKEAETIIQTAARAGFELQLRPDQKPEVFHERLQEENDRRTALDEYTSRYRRLVARFDAWLAKGEIEPAEADLKEIEGLVRDRGGMPPKIQADETPESLHQRLVSALAAREERAFQAARSAAAGASGPGAAIESWNLFLKAYPASQRVEEARAAIRMVYPDHYGRKLAAFNQLLEKGGLEEAERQLESAEQLIPEAARAGLPMELSADRNPDALRKKLNEARVAYIETQAFLAAMARVAEAPGPQDAVAAWKAFLEKHPTGRQAGNARQGILEVYPSFYLRRAENFENELKSDRFEEAMNHVQAAEDLIQQANQAGLPMSLPGDRKPEALRKRLAERRGAYERRHIPGRIVQMGTFELPLEEQDAAGNPIRKGADEKTGYPLEIRHRATGMHFLFVPAGRFLMGSPESEKGTRRPDEEPHAVTLAQFFYMGKHEVTLKEVKAFDQATGRLTAKVIALQKQADEAAKDLGLEKTAVKSWIQPGFRQTDAHPAVHLSWNDVEAFLMWLNLDMAQPVFRLPTEAEWEYACRGGSASRHFWGDDESEAARFANINKVDGARTSPVGSRKPNGFGLYDMLGNVREWCEDGYDEGYYRTGPAPVNQERGKYRVWRGGGWLDLAKDARCAARGRSKPEYEDNALGFRLVAILPALNP